MKQRKCTTVKGVARVWQGCGKGVVRGYGNIPGTRKLMTGYEDISVRGTRVLVPGYEGISARVMR